jgi:HEAT repeat protein
MNQIQSVANSIRSRLCLLEDQVRNGDSQEAILRGLEDDIRCVRERAVALAVRHLEPETLGELLADESNATLRNSALTALERQGPYAIEFLEKVTRGADADLAMFAVQALARIGAPRTIPLLLTLLNHRSENVGLAAIEALGDMHADDAVPRLLENLNGSVWRQFAIIRTLGLIGDARALDAILTLRSHPMLIEPVVEALGNIGSDRGLPALASLLVDPDASGIRDKILVAIHQILNRNRNTRLSLPAGADTATLHAWLEETACSGKAELADAAFSAVLSLQVTGLYPKILRVALQYADQSWVKTCLRRHQADISAALPEMLKTADVQVRCAVLESGVFRQETIPAVVDLLEHPDHRIVRSACVALGNAQVREIVPRLLSHFRGRSRDLQEAATEALSRMPPDALGELRADLEPSCDTARITAALDVVARARCIQLSRPVQRLLDDRRDPVRKGAMRAIGQMDSDLGEELLGLFEDPDRNVAIAAIEATVDLQDRAAAPRLIAITRSPGPLRYSAIRALGRMGDPDAAQPLRECFDSAAMHEKLEIVEALARIRPSWIIPYLKQVYYKSDLDLRRVAARGMLRIPDALSVEDLAGMASDPDWSIRGLAAGALDGPYGARGQELLMKLVRDDEPIVAGMARRSMGGGDGC